MTSAQKKSVEQVALERLGSLFDTASSPQAVLRAIRKLPHPSASVVNDLDAAIAAARLPVSDQGAFARRALTAWWWLHWNRRRFTAAQGTRPRRPTVQVTSPVSGILPFLDHNASPAPSFPDAIALIQV